MRKIMTLALAVLLVACSPMQKTETKEMNQLSFSTEQAAWMSAIACDEAKGDLVALESAIHNGLEAELTVSQIKEALSQLYAYTGFPRSLNALGVLQNVVESPDEVLKSKAKKSRMLDRCAVGSWTAALLEVGPLRCWKLDRYAVGS